MAAKKSPEGAVTRETEGAELELLQSISEAIGGLSDEVQASKEGMASLGKAVASLAERVSSIEKGGADDFMRGARPEDVAAAAENRKGVDPSVLSIVDETLGTDFGVEMVPLGGDRLGYLFTLVVPERMNDNVVEKRPVKDPETGDFRKDPLGGVLMEDFRREDRRSRIVSSADAYSAIREQCERVRANITAHYAASRKPMPGLNTK